MDTEEDKAEEDEEDKKQEFDKKIVDNDSVTVDLISVERIVDKDWDEERIEVTFEDEIKRDDTIEVQAREVSVDGKKIDEMMLSMSTEVASDELADAVFRIENYDGDLPYIGNNFAYF